jgi:hypothetical protein
VSTERYIKFPHRRPIGTLFAAPASQPEEWEILTQVRGLITTPENQPIKWEWLEEARGNVSVPAGYKVKLKITSKATNLAALAELGPDDLHALDLGHSENVNASLAHIAGLSGLRVLELTYTNVADDGLIDLQPLINLQSLGLSHSQVTTEGLRNLACLKNLREVWLSGTDVTDAGLSHLAKLNLLVQLGLSGTKVTDAGLEKLAVLKNLLRVYLFNTKVSHNGTQSLRTALPACRVKWHPSKVHTLDAEQSDFSRSHADDGDLSHIIPPGSAKAAQNMDESRFWSIIDALNWQEIGNDSNVIQPAVDQLSELEIEDICAFSEILAEKLYQLDAACYAREIGTDAFVGSKGSFAQNWFLYVRCCAVANGNDFYQAILKDPQQMPKDMEFQVLLSIAPKAFKKKTGHRFNYASEFNYETFANHAGWADA